MEHIAKFIVKHRRLVLIVAFLLLIPSLLGALATRINYDIFTYLPAELDSMLGEKALEDDFHMAATGMITIEGLPYYQVSDLKGQIEQIDGVNKVLWLNDLLDPAYPASMLPTDLRKFMTGENDATLMIVRFDGAAASNQTMNAVSTIKSLLQEKVFFGGVSVILEDTKELINQEMPFYVLVAVGASLVVLFLAVEGTVVPFLFMLGLLFPIAYNFGTNIIFGEISYITEALATVLQLGVTMDFSIFLLSRYEEERKNTDNETAMVRAICNTFTSITASSLTTIAGFLALCTMRLTLGRDIGLVMAKGVALGVFCTVVVLPCLLLQASKAIEKYHHRTLIPELDRVSRFVPRHYKGVLVLFIALFIPFAVAQSKTEVYYKLFDSLPQSMTGIVGTKKLGEDFGMITNHFVLIDDGMESRDVSAMCAELEKVKGVTQVLALDKFVGAGIPANVIPSEVNDMIRAGGRQLMLVNSKYDSGTDAISAQLASMSEIIKRYDPDALITGEGALTEDLVQIAAVDFANVSVASIAAVFIIIAISFKSVSIPVLLVAAIESAIYINMGVPYFTGTRLPFIASIVIGTIQLGATVDYAILMSTRFKEELEKGQSVDDALQQCIQHCSRSILSSGLTFFAATVGVSLISKMELLQSLCLLISRGAIISMFVIIFVLPCLLKVFAPLIAHTTKGWPKALKTKKESV